MSKRRSKLKDMAAAGNPWAVDMLSRIRAKGRAAGVRGAVMRRAGAAPAPRNPALAEAMNDAREIREWTDGPNPAPWRVYRLGKALENGGGEDE